MDDLIHQDLLAAHADGLLSGEEVRARYAVLFPNELEALEPLFQVAEGVHALSLQPTPMRPPFRAELKRDLLAQARQQQLNRRDGWRWAAIGASVTVAGVLAAAAAWRGTQAARLS